jgi:O-antigen/teichoic acid export membrane protein
LRLAKIAWTTLQTKGQVMGRTLVARIVKPLQADVTFRRLLANSGWLLSANTVSMALAFVQGIVVARMLGIEQYGILALVTTYATTVNQLIDSRVWETAIKFVAEYRGRGDLARATAVIKLCYLIDAISGVLGFVILYITARWASLVFVKNISAVGLIQFYALSVLVSVPLGTASALLRMNNRFDWLAYQSAGMNAFRLAGVIVIALAGLGIEGVVSVYLVAGCMGMLFLVWFSLWSARALCLTPWRQAPLRLLHGEYRRILMFTWHTNLIGTSRLVTARADMLVLGWLAMPAEVGFYKLAKTLAEPLNMVFSPLHSILYPEFSTLMSQENFRKIKQLQWQLSLTILAVMVPTCVLLTLGLPAITPLVFGEGFAGAIPLAQLLVWQIVWTPLIWLPGWLLALGRSRLLARLNCLEAAIYVVLLLIMVSTSQALGAAIATVLRFVVWTGLASGVFVYVHRSLTKREVKRETV